MEVLRDRSYLAKYLFRVMHIVPVVIVAGKIISDYLFGAKLLGGKEEGQFYMAMGILLIISGFVNTLLLKPK